MAATVLALGLGLLSACGDDAAPAADGPAFEVQDSWVRATVGSKEPSMTSAFMVLSNNTDSSVTVTGASTEVAETTEFHDMAEQDGKMMMMQLEDGIELKPQSGVILQPGGKHVMLMGMKKQLKAGDEVTFTLSYGDGKSATVTAPVKDAPEEEGHYHAPSK